MDSTDQPAPSTPEIDFLRRMRTRHDIYVGAPFLEDNELLELDLLLADAVEAGPTAGISRRAHAFLVLLQEKNDLYHFLDNIGDSTGRESDELANLIKPGAALVTQETPAPVPATRPTSHSDVSVRSIPPGEALGITSVVLGVAASSIFTYLNPLTADSLFWVAAWAVVFGGSFVADMRHRTRDNQESVSVSEGLLVTLLWALASVATVLIGGQLSGGDQVSTVAFISFAVAASGSRAITGLIYEDDEDEDEDED